MRIRGWSIDGFGHFRDHEVSDIGDGLTVFHGPNEAGKSTLLAFIRGMLFGFPDRRSREPRYEPTRGGRHGGRLMLDVEGESWTLEREVAARGGAVVRVFTPRGEGTEEDLRLILGSADSRLFRSVFAFSLTELQSFGTLDDEGTRSRIFSAGIVGAGRAARQVIQSLGDQADALFKPRGRMQVIPALHRKLLERRQATAEARRAARAYPELLGEEEVRLAEKQRLEGAVASARRQARHCEELIDLWPVWSGLQDAEGRYAALAAIDAFPSDPERRLVEATSRLAMARARHQEAHEEQERAAARVATVRDEVRTELAELAPNVAAHFETRDLYRNILSRLHASRAELGHATDAVERALRSLGGEWDEDRLLAFDASLPQRDRIRAWSERLRQTADDERMAHRDRAATAVALRQAERELETAKAQLESEQGPDPAQRLDPAQIEQRATALRQLRSHLAECREREQEAARCRAVYDERTDVLRLVESEIEAEGALEPEAPPPPGASSTPAPASPADQGDPASGTARLVPFVLGLLGLLVAGTLAFDRPILGALVAVLAIVVAVGAAAWLRRVQMAAAQALATERRAAAERMAALERAAEEERRHVAQREEAARRRELARRQALLRRREAAATRVAEARDAVERAQLEVEGARRAAADDAARLGLKVQLSSAVLDDADRALAEVRRRAARVEQHRRAVLDAEARCARLRDQLLAAERKVAGAHVAHETAAQEWAGWAQGAGLPEAMNPDSALDFIPAAQQAREHLHGRERLHASVTALEGEVAAWEARARELFHRAGASVHEDASGTGSLVDALHVLHTRCKEATAARERLAASETDLRASEHRLAQTATELRRCEEGFAGLLTEASASDEAHYRARMATFLERQRLRGESDRLGRQLVDRIGEGPEAEAIQHTLASGAISEWEREQERQEDEAATLARQLEDAIRAHQDAQRRREALETSADIASCEAEEQALVTEIDEAVNRWRALALARTLTEVTLREFVRTRQPAVVASASRMFATVTDGAYPELRQDEHGEGLSAVTRRGHLLGPEQLSRGTAEQLYLCLRLGLAAEFAAHGARLPLVMDDVCVNFDPKRARALATVLHDFAAGQQVIFFTCHPTTVELLRAITPVLDVRELPRHGPHAAELAHGTAAP